MDRGFLRKTQPDLHSAVHVSRHRRSKCSATRIVIFFIIMDITSGPDDSHKYSYTSILRLGLAAGDTPDAPLLSPRDPRTEKLIQDPTHTSGSGVTRGPSDTLHSTYATELGQFPEDALSRSGVARGLTTKNPGTIRLSLFMQQDPRRSRRRYRPPEISAEICSSQPPNPSINTRRGFAGHTSGALGPVTCGCRYQEEAFSTFQHPDVRRGTRRTELVLPTWWWLSAEIIWLHHILSFFMKKKYCPTGQAS
ncbi:phospholipase D delta-like [Dorcoceras hygrometricum]|uniref:Phospholipase D delta-like n=1 Tax=Dorcoceras hygrometricum TaxID=472368 RepID=A0A2Z7C9A8_9LAMI|nr:phospholipase D delta-like [Dorcoceras hygrometricum]